MTPPIPAPINAAVATKDAEQLRLIAIFHFIFAGLGTLGYLALGMNYAFISTVFNNPEMWKGKDGQEVRTPPPELFEFFKWLFLLFTLILTVGIVLNVLSGLWITRRRNRTFSLVIAGLNCLQVPFGTVLGVFTLVVLNRDSVRAEYEKATAST